MITFSRSHGHLGSDQSKPVGSCACHHGVIVQSGFGIDYSLLGGPESPDDTLLAPQVFSLDS